jgi:hypothetical protein
MDGSLFKRIRRCCQRMAGLGAFAIERVRRIENDGAQSPILSFVANPDSFAFPALHKWIAVFGLTAALFCIALTGGSHLSLREISSRGEPSEATNALQTKTTHPCTGTRWPDAPVVNRGSRHSPISKDRSSHAFQPSSRFVKKDDRQSAAPS